MNADATKALAALFAKAFPPKAIGELYEKREIAGVATNSVVPGTTDLEINKAIARTITKAQLDIILADLRAGNLYANVHTPNFPGGEIRGQMTKQ